jgi:hypothetical protein
MEFDVWGNHNKSEVQEKRVMNKMDVESTGRMDMVAAEKTQCKATKAYQTSLALAIKWRARKDEGEAEIHAWCTAYDVHPSVQKYLK